MYVELNLDVGRLKFAHIFKAMNKAKKYTLNNARFVTQTANFIGHQA